MFELKPLSPDAVPRALAKAERYRLLNEPNEAQSICLDVLAADPGNQQAITTMILALTDQLRPVILVLLFVGIVALVFGLTEAFMRNARVRSRLDLVGDAGNGSSGGGQSLRAERNDGEWKKLVDRIEKMGISLADSNNDRLRQRLIAAGYTLPEAPRLFTFCRIYPAKCGALSHFQVRHQRLGSRHSGSK